MISVKTKEYPTDSSFILIAHYGNCYEFHIEGVGWKIIEGIMNKAAYKAYGWESKLVQEELYHLLEISKRHTEIMNCTADLTSNM